MREDEAIMSTVVYTFVSIINNDQESRKTPLFLQPFMV